MYPEFAYTAQMQLITMLASFTLELLAMYFIADIILVVFRVTASKKQKVLFGFLAGSMLNTLWIYGIFWIGGMISFTPFVYFLITTPNPISALLYCYLAVRIFRLSPIRSVKTMGYIYLFWMMIVTLHRIISFIFFAQTEARYNYLLDAVSLLLMLVIVFSSCSIFTRIFQRSGFSLKFADTLFFHRKRAYFLYFIKALFAYCVSVTLPLLVTNQGAANVIVFLIIVLFFILMVCFDTIYYHRQVLENSRMHINALFKGNEELKGITLDFNNILQSYSGFLELGDFESLKKYHEKLVEATNHAESSMELSQRMDENPAIVSLLISKAEYAYRLNVVLRFSILCDFKNMYIDNMDLCEMLSCLVDNAIEAASVSELRKVDFAMKEKENGTKIVMLTNSTNSPVETEKMYAPAYGDQKRSAGLGLATVRKILNKHGNCKFEIKYYDYEISTYLEIKRD